MSKCKIVLKEPKHGCKHQEAGMHMVCLNCGKLVNEAKYKDGKLDPKHDLCPICQGTNKNLWGEPCSCKEMKRKEPKPTTKSVVSSSSVVVPMSNAPNRYCNCMSTRHECDTPTGKGKPSDNVGKIRDDILEAVTMAHDMTSGRLVRWDKKYGKINLADVIDKILKEAL